MDYITQQIVIGIAVIVMLAIYFGFKALARRWGSFLASAKYDVFELGSSRWFVSKKVYILSQQTAREQKLVYADYDWFVGGVMEVRPYAMRVTEVGKPGTDGRVKYTTPKYCTKEKFRETLAIMLKPEWLTEK